MKESKNTYSTPSDEEILQTLNKRLEDNLSVNQNWRDIEVAENYAVYEGDQWLTEALDVQSKNSMPIITINRVTPVIEAICGFEIQNRQDVKYSARLMNDEQQGFNSVMDDVKEYIEQNTNADIQYSLAFKDMLISGVGAIETYIDYDLNPNGEVVIRRIFPGFLLWNPTAREQNIADNDYIIKMKVVTDEQLKKEFGDDVATGLSGNSELDNRLLLYFNQILTVKTLRIIYEYQWREKKPFYRIENPFPKLNLSQYPIEIAEKLQILKQELGDLYQFNPDQDELFSVRKKADADDILSVFESQFGITLDVSRQKQYVYYRAIVTGNKVYKKSENFSQTSFSINFMTGKFSELEQYYFGLVRFCKPPQRMLNQAVSDYVGFLATSPKGGVDIEEDAVPDMKAFIETYTKARNVTVYSTGGLAKSRPKITAPVPSGLLEMIQYADNQIMQVCGVTAEFMGMMQSKEMNTSFYRQQIKQSLSTLASFFDAKSTYMMNQARLYIDCARILADNAEGILIRNVTGEANAKYFPLLRSSIAKEYDVVLSEMPSTPDQNYDTFLKLIEVQTTLTQNNSPTNLMPLILQYLPLPIDIKKKIEELSKPPEPTPPDPINQELLISEIENKKAQAAKLNAEAMKMQMEALQTQTELQYTAKKEQSDIEYQEAKTEAEYSKILKTTTEIEAL